MSDEQKMPSSEILNGMALVGIQPGAGCYPWEITPRQYLEYAARELASEASTRAAINAFSHAKKAIHAHVDFLLHNCGRCLRSESFPEKLERLRKIGVIAPEILVKYNRLRNLLEHEYIAPTTDAASELIDVATLFLEATRTYTRPLPQILVYKSPDGKRECSIVLTLGSLALSIISTGTTPGTSGTWGIDAADQDVWQMWVSRIMKDMQIREDPYVRCPQ